MKHYKKISNKPISGEVWKAVKNWEGFYEVSNYARVRSVDRFVSHWRGGKTLIKGRVLSQIIRKEYLTVNLAFESNVDIRPVHQLVGEAFVKNPNKLPQINHEDGIKLNNLPYNLKWGTISYNTNHAYRTGLTKKKFGEKHHNSKLSNQQRRQIKSSKFRQCDLADKYKVSRALICQIKKAG